MNTYLVGHKGFICGGCFKNIFNNEKIKDIDIFFEKEKDWLDAVDYYDKKTAGYGFEDDKVSEEDAEYIFVYENSKVKCYKNKKTGVNIELCCSIFGKPESIIAQFDFTIAKFAYYKEEVVDDENDEESHIESKLICHSKFFEHLHLKRLVIDDKIPFPMSTFERVLRYVKYGYMPCKSTKLKLAKSISELSTTEIEVSNSLYDGVD